MYERPKARGPVRHDVAEALRAAHRAIELLLANDDGAQAAVERARELAAETRVSMEPRETER